MAETISLLGIYISPDQGMKMTQVPYVEAIKDDGLKGPDFWDRYSKRVFKGFWQHHGEKRDAVREGTIFFRSHITGIGMNGKDTKRNFELSGAMNPWDLIGREFTLGKVRMRGVWDSKPCNIPSRESGIPGFEKLPKEHGGVRVQILSSGILTPGMPLVFVD